MLLQRCMIWRQLSLENCVFFSSNSSQCTALQWSSNNSGLLVAAHGSPVVARAGPSVYRAGAAFRGAPWRTWPRAWSMLRSRSRGCAFSSRQHRTAMHWSACLLSQGARTRVARVACSCLASCGAYCRPTTFCFTVQNKGCHSGFLRGKSLGKAKWREKSNHLGYCVIKGPCNKFRMRDLDSWHWIAKDMLSLQKKSQNRIIIQEHD